MRKIKTFQIDRTVNPRIKKFNGNAHIDALYKTAKWTNHREKFLELNPKCFCCGAKSTVSDHLKAHKGKEELFFQVDNIIPLCKKDHDTITALFDRHPVQKYREKLMYISRCRSMNDISTKIFVVNF